MQEAITDIATVTELIEAINDEGVEGIMEFDFPRLITSLFTDQHKAHAAALLSSLSDAAERLLVLEAHPTFAALMVLRQLANDLSAGGPAAPPSTYQDEQVQSEVNNLIPKLQMALIASLSVFPHPMTDEGRGDPVICSGMLIMLLDKVREQPVLQLAVEKAVLRLLTKKPACVSVLVGQDFRLNKLQLMIASLGGQVGATTLEGGHSDDEDALEEEEEEEEEEGDQKRRKI